MYMVRSFIKKYGTKLIVPVFMLFYLVSFKFLESRINYRFHVIQTGIDNYIPFCEYFIIPYFLWFFYIAATVIWFMFMNKDEKEYLQIIANLGIGMTLFILISWLYPNGHFLRPLTFPRDNIFTQMVRMLYKIDTPTNILPSIHVYNSIAAFIGIAHCQKLKKHPVIVGSSFILTVLIVASTVFLKQHTVIDVVSAFILNFIVYLLVYRLVDNRVLVGERKYPGIENS